MTHAITNVSSASRTIASSAGERASRDDLAAPPSLPACDDVMTLIARATFTMRDAQETAARGDIGGAAATRDMELEHARQAEEQAQAAQAEARSKAHWVKIASTVATVAAAVAAVASVVVTGGASAPVVIALAGTMLSAGSTFASGDTQKAMMVSGLVLSAGAGAYQLGAACATNAATTAATTAARQAEAAAEASLAQKLAMWIGAGARVTEGSARGVQGATTVQQKHQESVAASDQADAQLHRADDKLAQGKVDEVVSRMRDVEASARRAISIVVAMQEEIDGTKSAVIARMGRGIAA